MMPRKGSWFLGTGQFPAPQGTPLPSLLCFMSAVGKTGLAPTRCQEVPDGSPAGRASLGTDPEVQEAWIWEPSLGWFHPEDRSAIVGAIYSAPNLPSSGTESQISFREPPLHHLQSVPSLPSLGHMTSCGQSACPPPNPVNPHWLQSSLPTDARS